MYINQIKLVQRHAQSLQVKMKLLYQTNLGIKFTSIDTILSADMFSSIWQQRHKRVSFSSRVN